MADFDILGIDCGGTKVLAQSASFNSESDLVSPGEFHLEKNYSDHPNWNSNFFPVHLDLQRQEFAAGNICLTEPEMDQGDVIVETINSVISEIGSDIDLHLHLSPVIGENKRGVIKIEINFWHYSFVSKSQLGEIVRSREFISSEQCEKYRYTVSAGKIG